jgi:hypothetical protein
MHALRDNLEWQEGKDSKSEAKWLDQREEKTLKAEFLDSDVANFCKEVGVKYRISSDRAFKLLFPLSTISGSHDDKYKDGCLLDCSAVLSVWSFQAS